MPFADSSAAIERTLSYHQRSKHHLHQYARALGYLDWATQPDPFRTFAGAPRLDLSLLADRVTTTYADLFMPGAVSPHPLQRDSVAVLFELALGLSAWKQHQQSRWALRCNPSSGNLHPTEGYAILPELPGVAAGVYHYVSRDHCLERRCTLDPMSFLPSGTFLVGLSSIHWREAWKYGERAFRYCQHDVGHAIASVRYAAAALGWSARLLDGLGDLDVSALLGLDHAASFAHTAPADHEHPDAVLLVQTIGIGQAPAPPVLPLAELQGAGWTGQANPLSPDHVAWPIIDNVAAATDKPATLASAWPEPPSLPPLPAANITPAATLIRQRRSCLALDGTTAIAANTFFAMLDHLLPRAHVPPWDVLPWEPHIHAAIFVHRVNGLAPGLYLLERIAAVHERLHSALHPDFAWQGVVGCPDHLRLFLLRAGDLRQTAQNVSCHQDIASDGAFSLGMIADFGDSIRQRGAWWYRRLFWEAGVVGHVLYLEAEAAGIRSTGIGCYFDDAFHDLLGLRDDRFQSLYHFTVGTPMEDRRLTTLPAYAHLQRP